MYKQKRLGIMGGTFDPIHNGHIAIAIKAYEQFNLDKVLFIPSGISYLKKDRNITLARHRLNMVKEAIKDYDFFEASTIEIDRPGNTYTYETLLQLKEIYPDYDLFFIVGADSLLYIDKWCKPDIIYKSCTIVCAVRDAAGMDIIKAKGYELSQLGAKVSYINIDAINISSTMIRELAQKGQSIISYVPEEVEKYILQEHLYEIN